MADTKTDRPNEVLEIDLQFGKIMLTEQRVANQKSTEDNIINNIKRWMTDHKEMAPLGEEDPAVDLLIQFIKPLNALKMNNPPETFAAACIHLISGQDSHIKASQKDLADYFNIGQTTVYALCSKLLIYFGDFISTNTCVLKLHKGRRRLFLASTPIDRMIAATHTVMKKEISQLVIVDEDRNPVDHTKPIETYYLAVDKRKKKIPKMNDKAKAEEYSPFMENEDLSDRGTDSKEQQIIKNIARWMSDHRDMAPLGGEDPVVDLLIQFIKPLNALIMNNPPEIFAAACINLISCQDTQIKANRKDVAEYFIVEQSAVYALYSKLLVHFSDFISTKTCFLALNGGRMRLFLASTPIDRMIAATHTVMKKEISQLIILDEDRNPVDHIKPVKVYYLAVDKRKKKTPKLNDKAKTEEYSPLLAQ